MLITADRRALYMLWLRGAMASADVHEALMEPPLPHGHGLFPKEAADLMNFFEVETLFVDAAAIGIQAFDARSTQVASVKICLTTISDPRHYEIVQRLLSEDPTSLKSELQPIFARAYFLDEPEAALSPQRQLD